MSSEPPDTADARDAASRFKLAAVGNPAPDPELIAVLERLLVMARDGKLEAFVYAGLSDGLLVHTGYRGAPDSFLRLIGALVVLQFRLAAEWDAKSPSV